MSKLWSYFGWYVRGFLVFFVDASPKTLPMNPTNPATRMHLTTLYAASIPYRAVVFLKNGDSDEDYDPYTHHPCDC